MAIKSYKYKCGPEATDECDDYTKYSDNTYSRSHYVRGTGVMTNCNGNSRRYFSDDYTICEGITELGDYCFNASSVKSVLLPNSLVKIGSSCFVYTKLKRICLPKNLEEIGHKNFPSTLESSLTLPAKLRVFPTDNIQNCKALKEILVDDENKYFKSIDGILYNYDVTEILICPRGKEGRVIIPKTVRRIADYCFDGCFKLSSIELHRSIETIGCHAFSGLNLDRLTIPNSVSSIGEACFCKTRIHQKFRFSQRITYLPDYCFQDADIPIIDFLQNIEEIGKNCFESIWPLLPVDLRLPKIKKIGGFAFNKASNVKTIELPSCIQHIEEDAFSSTADDLKIILLSMAPFSLNDNAFSGIGEHATLYVPSGSKLIFENAWPWSSIAQIEEFKPQEDINEEDKLISDEKQLYIRLKNIALSITNADRNYLKDILQDLAMDYHYMDDEEHYNEAMQIIQFNRRFCPALIPDLEKSICTDWQYKYYLRFVSYCIMNSTTALLTMSDQSADHLIDVQPNEETPLLIDGGIIGDINLPTQEIKENVEVHFSGILRYLQNELSLAVKSIKIAVSWFTNYALFKQIKEAAQKGITVQLIINNDSVNNGGYCLNFNELIEAGVHISLVEYPHLIHHKFCIIDDKIVINGSYNWTRFSENNYENIVIFRENDKMCDTFDDEFEKMLLKAEHKDVKAMPDIVPLRPEYDRNAFRQYITEELDAEARQTSNQRYKITALHKASKLNPEYLEKLNPGARAKYEEEFKVIEQAESIANEVEEMVKEKKATSTATTKSKQSKKTPISSSTKAKESTTNDKQESDKQTKILQKIKASNLLMVLDVSGSMKETYEAGHVTNITKKVVSAALTLSDSQTVSLWEFGNHARPINEIGIENISDINNVHCKREGTCLQQFVSTADSAIMDNSLVIVFTDDDGNSIREAVSGMQSRKDVFWQIIVYGNHSEITKAIKGSPNISLVSMTDYTSKSDAEITQALLKDYIHWKS